MRSSRRGGNGVCKVYSSAKDVIQYTGTQPRDLGLETDEDLEELITKWLIQIKDLIDRDRNRDFHKEDGGVPPGLDHIARRGCANVVAQASFRRESTIVQVDDYTIQMVDDRVFTTSIRDDLKRYPRKARFGMTVIGGGGEV